MSARSQMSSRSKNNHSSREPITMRFDYLETLIVTPGNIDLEFKYMELFMLEVE